MILRNKFVSCNV